MKTIIFLALLTIPMGLYSATLKERIEAGLSAVEKKIGTGTPAQKANNLLRLEARKEVFNLQTYGRLFEDDFTFLKNLKYNFKDLEDVIGQAQKWEDLLAQKDLSELKKTKYLEHLTIEKANLAALLKKWDDATVISIYRVQLAEINLNEGQTQALAIESIKKEISNINKKKFNFTYGETGLHELRRSLRWPVMELELFKDLFNITKSECTASPNNLVNMGLKSKYKSVKVNPTSVLEIDYCSYIKTLGAVQLLGEIKGELEKKDVLNDKLPLELKNQTDSIYKELVPEVLNKIL